MYSRLQDVMRGPVETLQPTTQLHSSETCPVIPPVCLQVQKYKTKLNSVFVLDGLQKRSVRKMQMLYAVNIRQCNHIQTVLPSWLHILWGRLQQLSGAGLHTDDGLNPWSGLETIRQVNRVFIVANSCHCSVLLSGDSK